MEKTSTDLSPMWKMTYHPGGSKTLTLRHTSTTPWNFSLSNKTFKTTLTGLRAINLIGAKEDFTFEFPKESSIEEICIIDCSGVNDASFKRLPEGLKTLTIENIKVTKAILDHIPITLQALSIRRCNQFKASVTEMKAQFPDCRIQLKNS